MQLVNTGTSQRIAVTEAEIINLISEPDKETRIERDGDMLTVYRMNVRGLHWYVVGTWEIQA
jgi:hypothetical protein